MNTFAESFDISSWIVAGGITVWIKQPVNFFSRRSFKEWNSIEQNSLVAKCHKILKTIAAGIEKCYTSDVNLLAICFFGRTVHPLR